MSYMRLRSQYVAVYAYRSCAGLCAAGASANSSSTVPANPDTRRASPTNSNGRPKSPTTAGQSATENQPLKFSANNAPKRPRDSDEDKQQQQQQQSASVPSNGSGSSSPEEQGLKKRKVAQEPSGVKKKRVTWPADDKIANIRHFTKEDKEDSKRQAAAGQVSL